MNQMTKPTHKKNMSITEALLSHRSSLQMIDIPKPSNKQMDINETVLSP